MSSLGAGGSSGRRLSPKIILRALAASLIDGFIVAFVATILAVEYSDHLLCSNGTLPLALIWSPFLFAHEIESTGLIPLTLPYCAVSFGLRLTGRKQELTLGLKLAASLLIAAFIFDPTTFASVAREQSSGPGVCVPP